MGKVPGTHRWLVGVDLLVRCEGSCVPTFDAKCDGATHAEAIVKLKSFGPRDPPVCPVCFGPLRVLRRATDGRRRGH